MNGCRISFWPFLLIVFRYSEADVATSITSTSLFQFIIFIFIFPNSTECHDEEYDCEDETCIDASLVCNGRNNCKFLKDESECGVSTAKYYSVLLPYFAYEITDLQSSFLSLYLSIYPSLSYDNVFDLSRSTTICINMMMIFYNILLFFFASGISIQDKENTLEHLLIIILVFSSILGAMTTVFFFNCIRKLIRDQKIIRVWIFFLFLL